MDSEQNIKVSVIVPVYNVEEYLPECLASLAAQTLPEMEFILVDDGSTDNSGKIARDFAGSHDRFRFIHQENKGYAGAQNTGLSLARGEYIGFTDGDDSVMPEMFQKLYETAKRETADIAECSYISYFQQHQLQIPYDNHAFAALLKRNGGKLFHGAEAALFNNAVPWNRIYLRQMLLNYDISFPGNMPMAEDVPFYWESYVSARKIVLISDPLYVYRNQRPGQQTSYHDERLFAFFTLFDNFESFLKKRGRTGLDPWLLHMKLSRFCYGYENAAPEIRKEYFRRIFEKFTADGITISSPIAPGPGWGKYGLLRLLHPLTLRAILRLNEKSFARIVTFRRWLQNLPLKLRRMFHIKKQPIE